MKSKSERGGKRPGAGRKPGAKTKRVQEIAAKAAAEGVSPLEVMLENMRFARDQAAELLSKMLGTGEADVDALKTLLSLRQVSQDCAKDAAPYIHPKLASIEHKGDAENPIPIFVYDSDKEL
jgi:hypothetical protein